MSTTRESTGTDAGWRAAVDELVSPGSLALLAAATLVFSFTYVLYDILTVVGDPDRFLVLVAITLGVATLLSRVLRERIALVIGFVLLVAGLGTYLSAIPADVVVMYDEIIDDVLSLLTGLSVLRLQKIELWVLGFTPAPVFLTWYLALRRRYVAAVLIGGTALSFFVLTGDVDTAIALLGVVGAVGTVGFGRLSRFDGDVTGAEPLAIVLAAMIVLTMSVSVVPGGAAQPFQLLGSDGQGTVEGSLMGTDERVSIKGSIELSPETRFRVESDESAYWRTDAYDRYTGDGWVRTGGTVAYPGRLPGPPGRTETLRQHVTVESRLQRLPAAWRPVEVTGVNTDTVSVTKSGGLQPDQPFTADESFTVTSERPVATRGRLRDAGQTYPEAIHDRYTQLPATTPDRVGDRTDTLTARAETPYETARLVERWLENNREYSLDVERPEGDVADAFLFEMRRGYCTYYATTMVVMLRTQGIPARFVSGYTAGEAVDDGEHVVRGLNSHAWVEVYFPDVGWVKFDPTPGDPRSSAEADRLEAAGVSDEFDDGTDEAETTTPTPDEPDDEFPDDVPTLDPSTQSINDTEPATVADPAQLDTTTVTNESGPLGLPADRPWIELPSRERLALGLIVLAGAVAAGRRTGVIDRLSRAVWVRWQPRTDPERDVERAFDRLEHVLAREYRPRRPGETRQQYLAAIDADDRVRRVYDQYERVLYAGDRSTEAADDAVALVDEIVRDRVGWLG